MFFSHQTLFLARTALTNLLRHKARSLLTIISIIVGIATVIATLAIGRGAQEKIRSRLEKIGTNSLSIYTGSPSQYTGGKSSQAPKRLNIYDVEFLRSFDPGIAYVSSLTRAHESTVTYRNKQTRSPLTGLEPEGLIISNRKIKLGRNFLPSDLQTTAAVAILGGACAEALFGQSNPLDKVIFIEKNPFKIIGVLESQESPYQYYDINKEIYLPHSTCKRISGYRPEYVQNIIMSIHPWADITQIERLIKRAMRARHQLGTNDPDDFTIWNQSSMMAAAEQSSETLNLLLLIIASLSLLVGGLGVSNIMLVTVKERTKEIGIRMALGASPLMILIQFLFESIFLCIIGGCIGVLLGICIPHVLAFFVNWNVVVSASSIFFSVLSTSLIGLFFGYWPAYKASRLTIVMALQDS